MNDSLFGNCGCVASMFINSKPTERDVQAQESLTSMKSLSSPLVDDTVKHGMCQQNCVKPYIMFSIMTTAINVLSCSGKIGNVLVNYRCVETRDKSLVQGVSLLIFSLFALIPGPIIFGAIIDSTCVLWEQSCGSRGNCWVYHKELFRYYVNLSSACKYKISLYYYTRKKNSLQKLLTNPDNIRVCGIRKRYFRIIL